MHSMKTLRSCSIMSLAILGAATILSALPAHAASAPRTAILLRPSDAQGSVLQGSGYFQVTARPGTTVHLYAFVGNKSKGRRGIDIVPVDATSGEYGAVSYNLPQQRRTLVGAWVHLSHRWVSLGGNRGMLVPFALSVPRTLAAGQYVGAITAFVPAARKHIAQGIGLTVQTRVFTAIVVTVPGLTHAALHVARAVVRYRSNDLFVIAHIHNTGNVLLKARGYLWVYAQHSTKPWIHRSFSLDTTVPHTSVNYPLLWAHRVPRGVYRYAVSLTWNGGSAQSDSVSSLIHWQGGHTSTTGYLRTP